MDPFALALSDLRDLLREKEITLAESREEVKTIAVLTDERNKSQLSAPKTLPPPIPTPRPTPQPQPVPRPRPAPESKPGVEFADGGFCRFLKGTARELYHTEFTLQMFDGEQRAGLFTLRGWAPPGNEVVNIVKRAQSETLENRDKYSMMIAKAFGWQETYEHLQSQRF